MEEKKFKINHKYEPHSIVVEGYAHAVTMLGDGRELLVMFSLLWWRGKDKIVSGHNKAAVLHSVVGSEFGLGMKECLLYGEGLKSRPLQPAMLD